MNSTTATIVLSVGLLAPLIQKTNRVRRQIVVELHAGRYALAGYGTLCYLLGFGVLLYFTHPGMHLTLWSWVVAP